MTMDLWSQAGTGIIMLAFIILMVVSGWKTFEKAGRPGWQWLIPIFNLYVLLKIAGKPGWWLILLFIPLVNLVMHVVLYMGLAKQFGKGAGFGVLWALFPFVFFPVISFGNATYTPPVQPAVF